MTLTAAQKQAISPQNSVWVEASAGSGKTKVLIDRLLALLCDGTPPERLLCVTFTKAAAAEMRQRLMQRLSLWSHFAPAELSEAITALGLKATQGRLQRARTLFDEVLALAKGLRIQTLHSFAESLLKSFPLEAGVLPTFDVMDEAAAKKLFQTTQAGHLQNALRRPQHDPLWPAIELLSQKLSESAFEDCFHEILSKRSSFALDRLGETTTLKALARTLGLSPDDTNDTFQAFADKLLSQLITTLPMTGLRAAATFLSTHDKEALRQKGAIIKSFCNAPDLTTFQAFAPLWLTDKGTPRKTIFAKEVIKQLNAAACFTENAGEALPLVQDRVWHAAQKLKVKTAFDTSQALQTLGRAFLKDYQKRKRQKGVLDYDDLLQHACHLLKHDDGWVLYKLGHGLDHILIDEAQDTSALGWQLIEGLMDVFFTGDDSQKTLFVVGDPKQSIYSFQGADPTLFYTMRDTFERRIKQMGWPFKKLSLTVSFRAAPVVLQAVDAVFAQPLARKGLGEQTVVHKAHKDIAGSVTLWPLVQEQSDAHANAQEPAASDGAPDPLDVLQTQKAFFSGQAQLAFKIALYIKESLDKPLWLNAQARPLAAGDIMILLRKRGPFMPLLVRFLKDFDLPVMGQDRLILTQALVI
ncbi:MAG: UvrD-helicase domain-containing protein, partial [Holosporaceae bacterium]